MSDDLQFRPMSKGLGFHHPKDSKNIINNLPPKKPAVMAQQPALFATKQKLMSQSPIQNKNYPTLGLSKALNLNETIPDFSIPSSTVLSNSKNATLQQRLISWSIDIITLSLLITLSSLLIFNLNNFSWDEPLQFFQIDFFWNLYLPLGIGFYLFYFMLFERVTGQTLGKLVMGLKVVQINTQQPPKMWQSFLRSFFNLISLGTMGLLTVYDVVNWSLNLKVVKTKN